jgi:hypothetical protein
MKDYKFYITNDENGQYFIEIKAKNKSHAWIVLINNFKLDKKLGFISSIELLEK